MAADKGDLQTHHLQKRFASVTGQPVFKFPQTKRVLKLPDFPRAGKPTLLPGRHPEPGARLPVSSPGISGS